MHLTVAIIGAGPLGRWLAVSAARAGFRVLLEDVMPANLHHAQEFLRQQLGPAGDDAEGREFGSELAKIRFVSTIEEAVREADLAIDCVPDELESKLEILWLLDRMAPPRTILLTPTARLSISDLAGCTYRPDRCVAAKVEPTQFVAGAGQNLELRTTPQTSEQTVSLVREFWQRQGIAASIEVESSPLPKPGSVTR